MSFNIGFPERNDMKKLVNLDREAFNEDLIIDTGLAEEWYDANKYQWLVAKDEDENALGYLGIFHIGQETYAKLISGEISEKDLTYKDFVEFGKIDKVYCYIDGFVVKQKNTRVAISLLNKSIGYVRFLKQRNIEIQKIITIAVSSDGIKLCEKLGFKQVRKYEETTEGINPVLFELDLRDENFSRLINAIKEVILKNDEYLSKNERKCFKGK